MYRPKKVKVLNPIPTNNYWVLLCVPPSHTVCLYIWWEIRNMGLTVCVWQYVDEKVLMWFQFYTQCACMYKGGITATIIHKMGCDCTFHVHTQYVCMIVWWEMGSVVKSIALRHAPLVPVQYYVIPKKCRCDRIHIPIYTYIYTCVTILWW